MVGVAVFIGLKSHRKEVQAMSKYPLKKLLQRWAQGLLTKKQAIGQILQHLLSLEERIKVIEQTLRQNPPDQKGE